jgi:hypothetical protein
MLMFLQAALIIERFITLITGIWLLPAMYALMPLQITLLTE